MWRCNLSLGKAHIVSSWHFQPQWTASFYTSIRCQHHRWQESTLQSDIDGESNLKVISAWLIRQDGTEEYSDLSPFWGCEITDPPPIRQPPSNPSITLSTAILEATCRFCPALSRKEKRIWMTKETRWTTCYVS